MATSPTWVKDPDEELDYPFDWSEHLAAGETISSYTVTVADGITLDSSPEADGVVTAWLSGGTLGTNYDVTCVVVTNQGRTIERTRPVHVRER